MELGIYSKVLFLKSELNAPFIFSYHKKGLKYSLKRLVTTFFERVPLFFYPKRNKSQIFSTGWIGLKLSNHPLVQWADVIHIQWANHGFVNIREIENWRKPIVWTLRDMWAFTGGCHYSFECNHFKNVCGSCPALGSHKVLDLSTYVFKQKLKYLKKRPITWIAISKWMQQQAIDSTLLKDKTIEIIYSGIDASHFELFDKYSIRLKLNLPVDKKIILIGANNIRQTYKGFEYVISTLNNLDKEYLVLTFGSESFAEGEIPQKFIHFGICKDEMLAMLYSASDIFFGPSVAEAMGKTFLEAQFCGLPVVCFSETGPADIVKHKITGYLAKFKDSYDLVSGIKFSLNKDWNRVKIRNIAVQKFDIVKIAKDYIKIYEKSIVDWRNSSF